LRDERYRSAGTRASASRMSIAELGSYVAADAEGSAG